MLLLSNSEGWLLAVEKKEGEVGGVEGGRSNLSLEFIIPTWTAALFLNLKKNLYLPKSFLSIGAHAVYASINYVPCQVSLGLFLVSLRITSLRSLLWNDMKSHQFPTGKQLHSASSKKPVSYTSHNKMMWKKLLAELQPKWSDYAAVVA